MKKYLWFCIFISAFGCTKKEELASEYSLEGSTLSTGCIVSGLTSYKNYADFNNGSYWYSREDYGDKYCGIKTLEQRQSGTYTVGNTTGSSLSEITEIDVVINELTIKSTHSQATAALNSNTMCGFSDWSTNTTKSVLGLTCAGNVMPPAGTVYYDIFSIALFSRPEIAGVPGTAIMEGDVQFGYNDGTYDGTTPAKRPTATSSIGYRR